MTEIITWHNALQMGLGILATLAIYAVGVTIGATVKWIRETFIDKPADDDPAADVREPPIPTSSH